MYKKGIKQVAIAKPLGVSKTAVLMILKKSNAVTIVPEKK